MCEAGERCARTNLVPFLLHPSTFDQLAPLAAVVFFLFRCWYSRSSNVCAQKSTTLFFKL